MTPYKHIPLPAQPQYTEEERLHRATAFCQHLRARRTVRHFSPRTVPREVIEQCLLAGASAPSGANQQPWFFAVVENAEIKRRMREEAEAEERAFYNDRASQEWLEALAPLGTDAEKPFLEIAPYLIVVFTQKWHVDENGVKHKHYYSGESVGIACGMLLAALHDAGLVTLTHTPSPMRFLNEILGRPTSERAEMIIVAGHPAETATVPAIGKKTLGEISRFY